jgi:hypothetical protein
MFNRQSLRAAGFGSLLAVLVVTGTGIANTASASTGGFSYETAHWTTVDISLAGGDGSPALLSFYSQGDNGLRLLENAFTDANGHYTADMRLPAHLNQVVIMVRTAERQDTLTLPIDQQAITYVE